MAASKNAPTPPPPGGLVGTSVLRTEDDRLLRGDTTYVANLDLDDVLVAHFVTSTEAHASIVSIDTTAARSMPGVVDIVTAAEIGTDLGQMPGTPPGYVEGLGRTVLPTDRVRFVGEAVAVVVADTEAQAADAVETIIVEYEPLPPVVGIDEALRNETVLFPDVGTNVVADQSGGIEGAVDFSECEVIVEAEFVNQRLAPCPIEPRSAASWWTDDGRLVHHASCQGSHPQQKMIATCYGLEPGDVRVVTADVGGSFGAKARLSPEDMLLPLLADRTGRPVRWTPFRSADMAGMGHSRGQRQRIKIGGDSDGTITALEVDLVVDCGAHPIMGIGLARNAAVVQPGPLRLNNVGWTIRCVVTNTTPVVAYRGAGRPEGGALVDRAMNMFAAEVGIDQLTIRRINMLRADELPWTNPSGVYLDSGDYHEALELLAAEVGYGDLRADQAARRAERCARQLGVGLSTFIDRTAGIPGAEYGSVELRPDGSLYVLTGSSPYGQGHYTTWAMLVADRTGVPLDRIEVFHGDTDVVPRGGNTGGSRSVQKAGSAVATAADDLVSEAQRIAADLLEADVDDVRLDTSSGTFHVAGAPGAASIGWEAIASEVASHGHEDRGLRCESDYESLSPTAPYGAYGAVVEVDTDTGRVELVRMVTVDDAGTIVNRLLALGQVHGGLGQAIGQALYEEFVYDTDGNPLTSSFIDYGIPSAADMPPFECHLTENPSPQNVLGAKGIAESGTIGGVPAVQNAVVDALAHLGIRHIELPLSPNRVWQAIQDARVTTDEPDSDTTHNRPTEPRRTPT